MPVQHENGGQPHDLEVMDLKELMPSDWHEVPVSVSSYRAFCLRPEQLRPPKLFDLLGVKVQLNWGAAPYFKSRLWMEPQTNGNVVVYVESEGFQHAPPGPFVMLMAQTEEDTSSRLRSVVALLRLALGRNIAVEPLGNLGYTASIPNATATEPSFRDPTSDPAPDITTERLGLISQMQTALGALDEQLRNRVELSLQWYFRDRRRSRGSTAFLCIGLLWTFSACPSLNGSAAWKDSWPRFTT